MSGLGHVDLFSGIGGFALAAQWNGLRTEVFCEKDERCRVFLQRTYSGIPVWDDIKTFDGTKWRGAFLLTAGVPCQPASRAGKQRGKEDDRWLWPAAFRVVSEARPDWCLFENPPGINDVGLDGILADLEGLDYEVAPPLIIPACAVGSPQIRNRYWILAHSQRGRCEAGWECRSMAPIPRGGENDLCKTEKSSQGHLAHSTGGQNDSGRVRDLAKAEGCWESGNPTVGSGGQGDVADTMQKGRRSGGKSSQRNDISDASTQGDLADTEATTGIGLQDGKESESPSQDGRCNPDSWGNYVWLPCADGKVRRAPDNSFGLVDGLHRSLLGALGNSIVPQVAYQIIKAIKEASHV